jgi:hypothetical protein
MTSLGWLQVAQQQQHSIYLGSEISSGLPKEPMSWGLMRFRGTTRFIHQLFNLLSVVISGQIMLSSILFLGMLFFSIYYTCHLR